MKLNFYALWRAATAACLIFLCAINSGRAQGTIYHPPIQDVGPLLPAGAEADTVFSHRMNYIFSSLEKQRVPKGLLLDFAFEFTSLANYNGTFLADSNLVDDAALIDVYRTLYTARIHSNAAAMDLYALDSDWFNLR